MGFCYGERTVDVGQTMGLKAPLVWVTPSTSINNYELKAQDLGHVQKIRLSVHSKEWERVRLLGIRKPIRNRDEYCPMWWAVVQDPTRHAYLPGSALIPIDEDHDDQARLGDRLTIIGRPVQGGGNTIQRRTRMGGGNTILG